MCQMCDEYDAELRRMGIIEKIAGSDETLKQLDTEARRHGRSIEEDAAERLNLPEKPSREEMLARFERTAELLTPQTDGAMLLREDRDR